jgi:hypothetical protein
MRCMMSPIGPYRKWRNVRVLSEVRTKGDVDFNRHLSSKMPSLQISCTPPHQCFLRYERRG